MDGESMLSAAGFRASKQARRLPFTESEMDSTELIAACGMECCELCSYFARGGSLSKTWPALQRGRVRSREAWRWLATNYPISQPACRLRALARSIADGGCSGLPTLTARDWRSPGSPNHPRLFASRGEPLTETLGCRLSPEFCEWLMGFPAGWTDVGESSD